MPDLSGILIVVVALGVGIVLLWLGDIIRRRTEGRIRHAEVHLIAWVPTLFFEGVIFWASSSGSSILWYALPLVHAGVVYVMWFSDISMNRRAWEQSEQYLDKHDAQVLKEKRRRERIESYKHKGSVPRE